MRKHVAIASAPWPLVGPLLPWAIAMIVYHGQYAIPLLICGVVWLVITVSVWRSHYLAKRAEMVADLHPRLTMVMPFRQHEEYLEILAHTSVDNRGTFTETRDWEMRAKVNGEMILGMYSGSVAWEDHIENKAARIGFGEIRSGEFASVFYGATLETLSLDSVVMRFWDAFGKQYTAGPAKADDVVRHFPHPAGDDG
jgi:hypothetical protein